MPATYRLTALVLCGAAWLAPARSHCQGQDVRSFVRNIVANELNADANDHSRWMFQDQNRTTAGSTVKLVVQTPEGDLSKTIAMNGHPLNAQQKSADEQKMHRFATDADLRQKKKRDSQQDEERAASMTKMLPDAFLWTKTSENGSETTLSFKPDPKFDPPSHEARVFAAMAGTMVVNTEQKRIKSLQGTLTQDVTFGYGLFGRLNKGGTFHVERQEIGPKIWEITNTKVNIEGHALIFKSISEQQDEQTSHYKPAPASITLAEAEEMLNDGTVARKLGVSIPE
jgi:hypothetical protein